MEHERTRRGRVKPPPGRHEDVERERTSERRHRGARARAAGRRRVGRQARLSLLCLAVLAALLAAGWLWFRDSSLVRVEHLSVTGEAGPDSDQIRSALTAAARNMTTLDVRMNRLRAAVAPYPVVQDLKVSPQFPHGMRIEVVERLPVGVVVIYRRIAVAADGTLMYDVPVSPNLPAIPLRVPPRGKRVTDPEGREAIAMLAAAPQALLARVSQVTTDATHGLVAQIREGPSIYFGPASQLEAKWLSAEAVLADPGSAGAQYIDVTDPQRPAAGAQPSAAGSAGSQASASAAGTTAAQSPSPAAGSAAAQSPAAATGTAAAQSPAPATSSGAAASTTGGG
jgi:cell division protein FtsQ